MKKELILAFNNEVNNIIPRQGVNTTAIYGKEFQEILSENVMILPRYIAETSKIVRHPIPYVMICRNGGDEVLVYRRGKGVGESRLSGNSSVGVGGHVDLVGDLLKYSMDGDTFDPMKAISYTVTKEIGEELGIRVSPDDNELVGILRDDSNEVGKVHLGWLMIHHLDESIDSDSLKFIEEELETVGWMNIKEIDVECDELNFENWSKIAISHIQSK